MFTNKQLTTYFSVLSPAREYVLTATFQMWLLSLRPITSHARNRRIMSILYIRACFHLLPANKIPSKWLWVKKYSLQTKLWPTHLPRVHKTCTASAICSFVPSTPDSRHLLNISSCCLSILRTNNNCLRTFCNCSHSVSTLWKKKVTTTIVNNFLQFICSFWHFTVLPKCAKKNWTQKVARK